MKETIAKIIELARLQFPEEEVQRLSDKATHILKYVELLKEVDTSQIEATSHAVEVDTPFRRDEVQKFEKTEKILEIAPLHSQNFFEVPKVIDEN